jgi:hypothetical protein
MAVLPLNDDTLRPHAGEIVGLHLLRELVRSGGVQVIDPGQVRQVLIDTRTIPQAGITLAQGEVLRALLDLDMIVGGTVSEYREGTGTAAPLVEFTAYGVSAEARQVVWLGRSYVDAARAGFFFEAGRIRTTHDLTRQAVRGFLAGLARETDDAHRRARREARRQGRQGR